MIHVCISYAGQTVHFGETTKGAVMLPEANPGPTSPPFTAIGLPDDAAASVCYHQQCGDFTWEPGRYLMYYAAFLQRVGIL